MPSRDISKGITGIVTINKAFIVVTTLNAKRFVAHLETGAGLVFDIKTDSRIILANSEDDKAKESKFQITQEELNSIIDQLDDKNVDIISINLS